jgi:GT2 family glycosyltransferase
MNNIISIIIPNYNGKSLLEANLPSVYKAIEKTDFKFEVIVIDDASTDDSVSFLATQYPSIGIIKNERNKGFSPSVNLGIQKAIGNLVLLLNTDISLFEDYFQKLLNYFEDDSCFGVSGRFIGLENDFIQEAAKYPNLTYTRKIKPFNFYVNEPNAKVPTLYLCGGCSLFDKQKLLQLGGLNEAFAPFYVEDAELSIRAWRNGWACYYEHDAVCRHPASSTIKKYKQSKYIWLITQRNKLFLHSLHLSMASKLIWYSRQFFTLAVQLFVCNWKYHQAFFLFLKDKKNLNASKEKYLPQSVNKTPLEKIMRQMKNKIDQLQIVKV